MDPTQMRTEIVAQLVAEIRRTAVDVRGLDATKLADPTYRYALGLSFLNRLSDEEVEGLRCGATRGRTAYLTLAETIADREAAQ